MSLRARIAIYVVALTTLLVGGMAIVATRWVANQHRRHELETSLALLRGAAIVAETHVLTDDRVFLQTFLTTLAKANRFGEGVALAEDDFRSEIARVLAFESALQTRVNAMPDATLEDRIKKSAEWQRGMAAFK